MKYLEPQQSIAIPVAATVAGAASMVGAGSYWLQLSDGSNHF